MDEEIEVRRAAVLSVLTETYEADETPCGPRGRMTDVKVWTSLAAAREPTAMRWDPVKQRFDVPPEHEHEPEPEQEPEDETEPETEPEEAHEDEVERKPSKIQPTAKKPKPKPKKKRKKKPVSKAKRKKKPKKPLVLPDNSPDIVYAKLRTMK